MSGPAGFVLTSVASNEPDHGLGDGDTPNDIQGWVVGTSSTSGQLKGGAVGDWDWSGLHLDLHRCRPSREYGDLRRHRERASRQVAVTFPDMLHVRN